MTVAWTRTQWEWPKGLGSGCVLEVKSTGLADGLNVEGEGRVLILSNWAEAPFIELSKTGEENFLWLGEHFKRPVVKV